MGSVLIGVLLAGAVARGAEEPPYPAEAYVRIVEIAENDAFHEDAPQLVGRDCRVQQAPLIPSDPGWWAGGLGCDNGSSYQFARVRVARLSSATVPSVPERSEIVLRELAPDDSFFADQATLRGLTCVVSGQFTRTEGPFWGGPAECSDGMQYYFYKVAFEVADPAVAPQDTAAWLAGQPVESAFVDPVSEDLPEVEVIPRKRIRRGRRVVIYGIADADAFAKYRDLLVGRICRVRKGPLEPSGPGYHSGTLSCDGTNLLFYQVEVEVYRR
jgi:hypothetical protein